MNKKVWLKFKNKFNHYFPNLKLYNNNNNKQKSKILNLFKTSKHRINLYLNYSLKNNNFLLKKLHFLNKPNNPPLICNNKCRKSFKQVNKLKSMKKNFNSLINSFKPSNYKLKMYKLVVKKTLQSYKT